MFVQVITARVEDAAAVLERFDVWERDLRPGAEGFLGSTGGITANGQLVISVRFSGADTAQRNSDRPEQGAWWQETSKLLADVVFDNSTDVEEWMGGGSDDAGFVQFIRGRTPDVARTKELNRLMEERVAGERPDLIGGLVAWHDDGRFTEVVYFTSEREARENEQKGFPPEAQALWEEWQSLISDVEYFDILDPKLR